MPYLCEIESSLIPRALRLSLARQHLYYVNHLEAEGKLEVGVRRSKQDETQYRVKDSRAYSPTLSTSPSLLIPSQIVASAKSYPIPAVKMESENSDDVPKSNINDFEVPTHSNSSSTVDPNITEFPSEYHSEPTTGNILFTQVRLADDNTVLTTALDSCATISLARTNAIPLYTRMHARPCNVKIGGFNNDSPTIQANLQLDLRVKLLDKTITVSVCLVDGLFTDLVLGMDSIDRHRFSIHGGPKSSIKLAGQELPVLRDSFSSGYECTAASRVSVPPRCAAIVSLRVMAPPLTEGHRVLVDLRKDLSPDGISALAASHTRNILHIPIFNSSFYDLKLEKGQVIGQAFPQDMELSSSFSSTVADYFDAKRERQRTLLAPTDRCSATITKPLFVLPPDLTPAQQSAAGTLINQFHGSIVQTLDKTLGHADVPPHHIDTGDHHPIHSRPRHISPLMAKVVQEEIEKMLQAGIVAPHQGPWSSPIHMVRKRDGNWRFCIDYRALNLITKDERWPLPRIDDLLDGLSGCTWFSTLDLASGFWQIQLDSASSEKAAFVTPHGLFKPLVLPFGLKNAPAAFQRALNHALRQHIGRICVVYIDDILIFSKTFEEHIQHVEIVLNALREARLQIRADKCVWFARELDYLGHHLSADGIAPTEEKVIAIRKARAPTNLKELRSFLGIANYYRRFVLNFAQIASPLNALLREDTPYVWTREQQVAFDKLIVALTTTVPLPCAIYDGRPFILDTDASNEGMGAVLSQMDNGVERPIAYWSAGYATNAQQDYSATDREMLAILRAMTHFRHSIDGAKVMIRTDHQPLVHIMQSKELPDGMRGRWITKLQQWNWNVTYRPGLKNGNADACSRNPVVPPTKVNIPPPELVEIQSAAGFDFALHPEDGKRAICAALGIPPPTPSTSHTSAKISKKPPPSTSATSSLGPPPSSSTSTQSPSAAHSSTSIHPSPASSSDNTSTEDDRDARLVMGDESYTLSGWQQEDSEIKLLKLLHQDPQSKEVPKRLKKASTHLTLEKGILRYKNKFIVPKKLRELIIQEFHHSPLAGGHFGRLATLTKIRRTYWWPGMKNDITLAVKSCESCQRVKHRHTPPEGLLHPLPLVSQLFKRIALDITGPFPPSPNGNEYLLVMVDYGTHWVEAFPIPDYTTDRIASIILREVVPRFGCPEELLSDRGASFLSRLAWDLYGLLSTKKLTTSSYHPQTNGLCERMNGLLKTVMTHWIRNRSDWEEFVPWALFAMRTTPSKALDNKSPYELLYGQQPRYPLDKFFIDYDRNPDFTGTGYLSKLHQRIHNWRSTAQKSVTLYRQEEQRTMKDRYDKFRRESTIAPGQYVYRTTPTSALGNPSFTPVRTGPYLVLRRISDQCELQDVKTRHRQSHVNVSALSQANYRDVPELASYITSPAPMKAINDKRKDNSAHFKLHDIPMTPELSDNDCSYAIRRMESIQPLLVPVVKKFIELLDFSRGHSRFMPSPVFIIYNLAMGLIVDLNVTNDSLVTIRNYLKQGLLARDDVKDVKYLENNLRLFIRKPEQIFILLPNKPAFLTASEILARDDTE